MNGMFTIFKKTKLKKNSFQVKMMKKELDHFMIQFLLAAAFKTRTQKFCFIKEQS